MEIRILHTEDASVYQDIRLEALKNHPEAFGSSYEEEVHFSIDVFNNRLMNKDNFTFGAFEKNQLVGVVTLIVEQKNKMKHRGNIVAMYVKPKYRGRGIAQKLMKETINQAIMLKEIEQIYLAVVSGNEGAINLYQLLGFEIYGIDKKALKVNGIYYDEELMVRFI
ncbi:GNAT family N-acetyltransferase [Niallia nealsonii]|uniref:GNAT family N-acetyltransferase n=1 Tax=Niallia nealsonii TaxID=115979 RepID=A0A2N0Z697_9BACI|nr:GNAT family N-acetyltransferase [Niallia nealsonii]PKG25041.1 GNAT family N-acetyltransferase [Niallia nealsonii]